MSETATDKTSKRDQVLEMVKEGGYTRQDIAEALDCSVASVSNQLTYLRWMGNFFTYDDDKVLSHVTEEEYNAWDAERKASSKSRSTAAAKTPQEKANALAKTVARQEKQLENYMEKLVKVNKELKQMPGDEALLDVKALTEANITILEIKVKQNKAALDELPEPQEDEEVTEETSEEASEDEDLL